MLKGKNIIITGGGKRVGKSISLKLAESGANLVITYNSDPDSVKNFVEELKRAGSNVNIYQLDQSDMKSVRRFVDRVKVDYKQIYGLVNNAAVFYKTPIFEVEETDYDVFMDTNLKGPFFLAKMIGTHMYDNREGRIINIADVSGEKIWPEYLPYCISKSGTIAMTRGLAKAFAPYVLVNAVSPGTVLLAEEYNEAEEQALIDKTPLKRIGKPEDIASAVHFLMTQSDFINGQILNVDGGRSIV